MLNDPHVEALIYAIEHNRSVSYERAMPMKVERQGFYLKVEAERARFEMKEHYSSEGEAQAAVQPFIDQWEFIETLRTGPGQFALRFEKPVIVDRQPSPGVTALSAQPIRANVTLPTPTVTVSRQYPLPPSEDAMDIDNFHVQRMLKQYKDYCAGQRLTVIAQVCCEEFKTFRVELKDAAGRLQIGNNVLKKVRKIANNKGGQQARHASAIDHPLTQYEVRFLEKAVVAMIFRAAKVAANPGQPMEFIDLGNLLDVSP